MRKFSLQLAVCAASWCTATMFALQVVGAEFNFKLTRERQLCEDFKWERQPVSGRPLVFPRSQMKYGMFQNYMIWWNDRPLFHDRSSRYPAGSFEHMSQPSFLQDVRMIKLYGVDGLANLANNSGHFAMYRRSEEYLQEAMPETFHQLPEFGFGAEITDAEIDLADAVIKKAVDSPWSVRIRNKVLISSYVVDRILPIELKKFLDVLRERNGDVFLFVADVRGDVHGMMVEHQTGGVSDERMANFKELLRSYLAVCDGVMFAGCGHIREPDAVRYDRRAYYDFYENVFIPAYVSVLNEEAYSDKFLGLSGGIGYINPRSGVNQSMDCTKNLRKTFAAAIKAGPDFIIMPEWNEFNENTCVQPTVKSSMAHQRIINYFMREIKKLPPLPNPGDDISVPNLILSYRQRLKLGEKLEIELLNVPDSNEKRPYKIALNLLDEKGQLVKSFPEVGFDGNVLEDATFHLATEELADFRALVPVLKVRNAYGDVKEYKGFHYIGLNASWNWDYLVVKQPLRDLLQLDPHFAAQSMEENLSFTGKIDAPEALATVEVLVDDSELYACDPANEFDRKQEQTFFCSITSAVPAVFKGLIRIENASSFKFRPAEMANKNFTGFRIVDKGIEVNQAVNTNYRSFFISIPRKDLNDAVVSFELDNGTFRVSAQNVLKTKAAAKSFPGRMYLWVQPFFKAADIPAHLNSKAAEFDFTTPDFGAGAIYHLRVISKSGKIWRSAPVVPVPYETNSKTRLRIFSESLKKVVAVKVPEAAIPRLEYSFPAGAGDVAVTVAGPEWYGEMGGGISYGDPFNRTAAYPVDAVQAVPERVIEDGYQCLKFDGKGNYFCLPKEAFPRGSFTLRMDIKPLSKEPQVVFRHHGMVIGSLTLNIVGGEVLATYVDQDLQEHVFATELDVALDQWNSLKISYDLREIKFNVNGRKRAFPLRGRALYIQPSVIGGHLRPGFGVNGTEKFFYGYLRSFSITHKEE